MNQFTRMMIGPRQWTHPELRNEVFQRYGEMQRDNPKADEIRLYNAAVEITRCNHRLESEKIKVKFKLGGYK